MKLLILLLCILLSYFSYGQDCNDIIKRTNEMRGETAIASPVIKEAPRIQVMKLIKDDGNANTIVVFKMIDDGSWKNNPQGLFIKFDDGTISRFANNPVKVEYLDTIAGMKAYVYQSLILLDKSIFKQFSKHKIDKFTIDHGDSLVTPEWGEKIRQWIVCVYNSK